MIDLGIPSDLTFYKLLKEQGSILAGILALLAGLAAYRAGRRQAKAVEEQNLGLKQSERCRLGRETLIAIGLIGGLLADALRNVEAITPFGDGQEQLGDGVINSIRKKLPALELDPVIDQLGKLDREIIDACFELRTKMGNFRTQITGVSKTRMALSQELKDIRQHLNSLRNNLGRASAAAQMLTKEHRIDQK